MQYHIGVLHFLERRAERVHQIMRELIDKTYGVGKEHLHAAFKFHTSHNRVQRCKQLIFRQHITARNGIEKRRLARVRIAYERHHRHIVFLSLLAAQRALL
ncbi:hypothetical protein SDC9_190766 [bioreactor metagenome]|uniref:Uncharacterized protein n=1 Tax=bioreactor metagenome TaxID=1076179 RepID=A0A645HW44_9ZZZZ